MKGTQERWKIFIDIDVESWTATESMLRNLTDWRQSSTHGDWPILILHNTKGLLLSLSLSSARRIIYTTTRHFAQITLKISRKLYETSRNPFLFICTFLPTSMLDLNAVTIKTLTWANNKEQRQVKTEDKKQHHKRLPGKVEENAICLHALKSYSVKKNKEFRGSNFVRGPSCGVQIIIMPALWELMVCITVNISLLKLFENPIIRNCSPFLIGLKCMEFPRGPKAPADVYHEQKK